MFNSVSVKDETRLLLLWDSLLILQGSILGPLLFLVYVNDLTENLNSNAKLFADDTSLFSIVADEALSNSYLNDNLKKNNEWAYKRKMTFNPDSAKPAHEVVCSRKKIYSLPSDFI